MSSSPSTRSVLRQLIRQVRRTIINDTAPLTTAASASSASIPTSSSSSPSYHIHQDTSLWEHYILSEYRRFQHCDDPEVIKQARQRASDQLLLFIQLREKERLRILDAGTEALAEENQSSKGGLGSVIEASAKRVGLSLPTNNNDNE